MTKTKQIILAKVRSLEDKAARKHREADKLQQEADELKKDAEKL